MRCPRRKRLRWLLQLGGIELAQIARHAFLNLREPALHLRTREILVAGVNCFELAAVDGNARTSQQAHLSAKRDKLRTHLADCGPRNQPTSQPHHLDVASSLALKPAARLNPIEIAVDVELQQHRRMVGRTSGCFRINTTQAKLRQINLVDKDIDRANWVILANPIFQAFREQRALLAIHPLNEAPHLILPRIRSRESHDKAFSHSQGQRRRPEAPPTAGQRVRSTSAS
jgi:hypothetical protein